MQYEYSLHYNEVRHAWHVTWMGFDQDRQMKGDVVFCNSFEDAISTIRSFAIRLEPDHVNTIS